MATDYGYNEDPFMVVKPGGGQDMKGYFHNSSNDTVATADTSRSGSSRSAEDRVSRRGHKSRGGDKHRGKSKDGGGGGGGGGGAFGDDFDFDEPAFPDDANFVPDDSHFEASGKDDGGGRRRRGAPERSASNSSNATAPESADNSAPRRGRRGVQASKSCDGADMEAALGRRGAPAGAAAARGAAGGARPNNPRVRRSGRRASMCGPSSSGASLTGASSSGGGFGGGMYSGGTAAAPVDDKIGNTTHSSPDGVDYGYGDFGGGGGGGGGGGSDGFASFDANFGNDNNADGGGGEKKSEEWLNDRSKNQRALLEGFKSGTGYFQDGSKMKGSCRNLMVEPMTAPDPRAGGGGGAPAGRRPRRRASLTGLVTPPSNFGKLDDGDDNKKNAKGGKGDRKAPSRSASSDGSVMAAMRNERDRRRPGGRRPGGEDGGGSGGGGGMSYSDRIMAGR